MTLLFKLTSDGLCATRLFEPAVPVMPVVETELRPNLLVDGPEWSMNGPGTKNGLLVISGEPGSGKSQSALDLLAQLAGCGVRFVFFDLKGELRMTE